MQNTADQHPTSILHLVKYYMLTVQNTPHSVFEETPQD